jgi:hypothetical protein
MTRTWRVLCALALALAALPPVVGCGRQSKEEVLAEHKKEQAKRERQEKLDRLEAEMAQFKGGKAAGKAAGAAAGSQQAAAGQTQAAAAPGQAKTGGNDRMAALEKQLAEAKQRADARPAAPKPAPKQPATSSGGWWSNLWGRLRGGVADFGGPGPKKAVEQFFATIEKGDLMSLHEYAYADTVKHVMWLEQGGASRAASASASAGGAMGGALLGGLLFGAPTAGAVVGSTAGGGVSNEEAKHLMCRSGLIARGRVVSMEEAIKTEFTMAGEDVPQFIAGPRAPAGAKPDPTTFAVVTVKFQGGASEKIVLMKDEADGKWKVHVGNTDFWNRTIVANHGDEGFSFGRGGAKARDVYVVTTDKTYKNRSVLYNNGGNSIYVSGNDVYVAGVNDGYATLWKNGVAQRLGEHQHRSFANSVFVSSGVVYVAGGDIGWEKNRRGYGGMVLNDLEYPYATLWKNGIAQRLEGGINGTANSVFVSGGNVYVAGNYGNLWKNGVAQRLEGLNRPNSVFVSGNDVYVAGKREQGLDGDFAILWKNGVAQQLGDGDGLASSVFVSGNDVYVAGAIGGLFKKRAALWKNGVAERLSDKSLTEADAVFVSNGDVYVGGGNSDGGWLWKNGVGQRYGKAVRSVFVK